MKLITTQSCLPSLAGTGKWLVFKMGIFLVFTVLLLMQGCKKPDKKPPVKGTPGLELVVENLTSPLSVTEAPDGTKRLFVVDQIGKIWIVGPDGIKMPDPFIDISSKMIALNPNGDERGLLGFTFHPDFKQNGRFFVYYNAPPRPGGPVPSANWNNTDRISEFRVSSANRNMADLNSEKIILEEDDPQGNHNGGTIAFGHDGYLYISIGDGGGANDVGNGHVPDWYKVNEGGNGQDVYANLLGNILRIDVNSKSPYGIPSDNPFAGDKPGKDEIYAFGLRNTYRFSFDMGGSHQLFGGDAGQLLYEEINIITKGGNYGWNVKEGRHCFNTDNSRVERPVCPSIDSAGNPLIDPIIELTNFSHPNGGIATTVIGGNVYRGNDIPDFKGRYIFGSFSQTRNPDARLYIAHPSTTGMWPWEYLPLKDYPDNLGQYLKGFGQDLKGEIYVTTTGVQGPTGNTGKVFKLALIANKYMGH